MLSPSAHFFASPRDIVDDVISHRRSFHHLDDIWLTKNETGRRILPPLLWNDIRLSAMQSGDRRCHSFLPALVTGDEASRSSMIFPFSVGEFLPATVSGRHKPLCSSPVSFLRQRISSICQKTPRFDTKLEVSVSSLTSPSDVSLDDHQQQQQSALFQSRRRARTNFSGQQLDTLEQEFASCHYPDSATVAELCYKLSISESRIQIWFQNRRAKWRKRENTRKGPGRPTQAVMMQATRSCSGVPIPPAEVELRDRERQLKRQRAGCAAAVTGRRTTRPRMSRVRVTHRPPTTSGISFRSSGDKNRRNGRNRLKAKHRQQLVPGGRTSSPKVVELDEDCCQSSDDNGSPCLTPERYHDSDDRDLTAGLDSVARSASPDCQTFDRAMITPRKKFTLFTIENLLHS